MKISLQDIVIDKDTQSRDVISEQVINEYAEAMQGGAKFPAIVVFYDGLNYYLVDGFHRYFAYLKLDNTEVEVIVHNGTKREAEIFSWGVNDKHGQPRSNATKRLIVLKALDDPEFAELSDRKIAEIVKLSHAYISGVRREISKKPIELPKVATKNTSKEAPPAQPHAPQDIPHIDPIEIEIKELADLNQQLHEENLKYKDKEMIIEGDSAKIEETLEELRKKNKILEMELESIKNNRNQLMSENAELKKTVNYWKKKYEKTLK